MTHTIPVTYRRSRLGNKGGQREPHTQKRFVEHPEDAQRKARFADTDQKVAAALQGVAA